MMPTDSLHLRASAPLPDADRDEDPARRVLPTDDDVPRETLDVLGQARDALMRLIGGVFQAAEAIVTALLHLVQTLAGRDVAETVDRRVADVLDPIVPRLPDASTDPDPAPPADPVPMPEESPASSADPVMPQDELRGHVRDVLLAHAASDAERAAVSPAFVGMVSAGVQFALSVERQFPGAIDALQERVPIAPSDEAPVTSGPAEAAPEASLPEPVLI